MKLSIQQVADALDLPVETVERWVRQGRIPFQRQQDEIHFRLGVLERWAVQHKLPFHLTSERPDPKEICQPGSIHEALQRGGFYYDIEGSDTESVLQSAVRRLRDLELSTQNRTLLLARLLEREAMASTGVGKGVAIPHPRIPLEKAVPCPTICTFFLKHAAPYQAIDDKPVFILFLLLSPSTSAHLHCLSRLAFCVRDDAFVSFLRSRPAPETLLARVAAFEEQLDAPN
ncbi:MAG: PTS sugar transporter subunit IIA [Desulfosarcinaceae bacterium]|nr:PTS sugar transporter subunit IIA [Desulfosarcinaceae bacterium]